MCEKICTDKCDSHMAGISTPHSGNYRYSSSSLALPVLLTGVHDVLPALVAGPLCRLWYGVSSQCAVPRVLRLCSIPRHLLAPACCYRFAYIQQCVPISLDGFALFESSFSPNAQPPLPPLIHVKARGYHRHHFDIPNTQAHEKSFRSPFQPNAPRRLCDTPPMSISNRSTNLHSSSYHFQWIGCRLRHKTGDSARRQLCRGCELGLSFGIRGCRAEYGVGGERGKTEEVAHGVVSQERHACVRNHAEQGRGEATVEVDEAGVRCGFLHYCGGCSDSAVGCCYCLRWARGLLMIYLVADPAEAGARVFLCLEGEAHADYFERVREEDRRDAC